MKKIYLLMLIALPFVYACSDDKDEIDDDQVALSLPGTTWEATDKYRVNDDWEDWGDYTGTYTLSFTDKDTFVFTETWSIKYDNGETDKGVDGPRQGIYEVEDKKIYLVFNKSRMEDIDLTVKSGKLEGVVFEDKVAFTKK